MPSTPKIAPALRATCPARACATAPALAALPPGSKGPWPDAGLAEQGDQGETMRMEPPPLPAATGYLARSAPIMPEAAGR